MARRDGMTSLALGELVSIPLASLVTLVTPVPVCQVLWQWHDKDVLISKLSENGNEKIYH